MKCASCDVGGSSGDVGERTKYDDGWREEEEKKERREILFTRGSKSSRASAITSREVYLDSTRRG